MDWKQISEDCPKSYDRFIKWNCEKNPDCPSSDCYKITDRDLYDFFDDNEIYVSTEPNVYAFRLDEKYKTKTKRHDISVQFRYRIGVSDDGRIILDDKVRKTRQKSESEAFLKALSILEERLNTK